MGCSMHECRDPAHVHGDPTSEWAWGAQCKRACIGLMHACRGTLRASMHACAQCMRACMETEWEWVWGPGASVHGDPASERAWGPGVCM